MWVIIFILPITVFCWIRNLNNLAPLSAAANVAVFFTIFVIFYAEIRLVAASEAAVMNEKLTSVPSLLDAVLFFGNAFLVFEGIGVVSWEFSYVLF